MDQIVSIPWIMEKARELKKKAFVPLTMQKPLTLWISQSKIEENS